MSELYHAAFQMSFLPSTSELESYIAGVVKGDSWCTSSIGLNVADKDFSQAFSDAFYQVFGVTMRAKQDKFGHWRMKVSNRKGRFTYLLDLVPSTLREKASWLRGLFDSEGNAQVKKNSKGMNYRRVSMYSTNLDTLNTAGSYLNDLGVPCIIRATTNSKGHKGTKTVYELCIRGGEANYGRFSACIGSSIARKQASLDAIVGSYSPLSHSEYSRIAQSQGAIVKHRKTMEITLPFVLSGIRDIISQGQTPKYWQCRETIKGFQTVEKHFTFSQLVAMARGE